MPVIFTPPGSVYHPATTPYISTADYTNAPTAIDTSALVPGGDAQANLVELSNVIRRASSWADNICHQTLAATLDTQTGVARVRSDGTVQVHCNFWPVLELDAFSAGPSPSTMAPVTDTADITLLSRAVLSVPVAGLVLGRGFGFLPGAVRPGDRCNVAWSYWNGWPHSTLAAAAPAGALSLQVTGPLPTATAGRTLTVWDGANTEQVVVASTFTGGTVLPLEAPTLYAHALPAAPDSVTVTALPDDVRQAVILLTSALINTRGAEALVMGAIGAAPAKSALGEGGTPDDVTVAESLLARYARTV